MAFQASSEDLALKARAKSDLSLLYEVLGMSETRTHVTGQKCPFCPSSDAFEVGPNRSHPNEYKCNCYSCGLGGDVFFALKTMRGLEFGPAMNEMRHRYGGTSRPQYQQRYQQPQRHLPPPAVVNGSNGTYVNGTSYHTNGVAPSLPYQAQAPRALPPIRQPQLLQAPQQQLVYRPPTTQQPRQELIVYSNNRGARGFNNYPLLSAPAIIQQVEPQEPKKRKQPTIDEDVAEKLIARAHDLLMNDFKRLMGQHKRGITEAVAKKYRLGFIEKESFKFRPWHDRGLTIPSAWVIPCTNEEEDLMGVKFHCEEAPIRRDGKRMDKCIWAPFGTEPAYDKETDAHPGHAYYGMWPHPDTLVAQHAEDFSSNFMYWIERIKECPRDIQIKWQDSLTFHKQSYAYEIEKVELDGPDIVAAMERAWFDCSDSIQGFLCGKSDKEVEEKGSKKRRHLRKSKSDDDLSNYTFICPGELKALCAESAGLMATAPTGGESWMPDGDWLSCFSGHHVWLAFDDDPPKKCPRTGNIIIPGRAWAARWAEALKRYGAAYITASGLGRKMKSPREIEQIEKEYAEKMAAIAAAEGEDF